MLELIPNLIPWMGPRCPFKVPMKFLALMSQILIKESYPAVARMFSLEVWRLIVKI